MIGNEWFLPSNTSSGGPTYKSPIVSDTVCMEYSTRAGEFHSFRVCLEVKHGRWKTLDRKWERKLFWSMFVWVGRKGNKWLGLDIFSLNPPKSFLFRMGRKLRGIGSWNELPKIPPHIELHLQCIGFLLLLLLLLCSYVYFLINFGWFLFLFLYFFRK